MTEMRITLPENNGIPMIIDHDDFFESDITLNLKFGSYELDYGFQECVDCGGVEGVPHLTVVNKDKLIFSRSFNHEWILFINIERKSITKYKININIFNEDDGDTCETCINNRFNFNINAFVDSYIYCFYSPSKGEYKKHLPVEVEELDEKVKEELK